MPGQKFCNVLEKLFTNLNLDLWEEIIRTQYYMNSVWCIVRMYVFFIYFFHFSFIYKRILTYFQLIAHLFVNMYIITCATCLVEY
jgi:hypothetical protein